MIAPDLTAITHHKSGTFKIIMDTWVNDVHHWPLLTDDGLFMSIPQSKVLRWCCDSLSAYQVPYLPHNESIYGRTFQSKWDHFIHKKPLNNSISFTIFLIILFYHMANRMQKYLIVRCCFLAHYMIAIEYGHGVLSVSVIYMAKCHKIFSFSHFTSPTKSNRVWAEFCTEQHIFHIEYFLVDSCHKNWCQLVYHK